MEKITLTRKELKQTEEIIEKLLSMLEIEGAFNIEPKEDQIDLSLETKDTSLVIGYHGEALESLQLIFSLIISKKLGRFIRVSIEVDNYKKNRTEYLEKLAESTKLKAIAENNEQTLFALKSWERRIIHLCLQSDEQVTSASSGEGKDRTLIIMPKA